MGDEGKESISISSKAFVAIAAHALSHRSSEVHGIVIGKKAGKTIQVTKVFPVCHETPTKPLTEMAMALVQAEEDKIIGWYTAPEHLLDRDGNVVAARLVASMASTSFEPILLQVDNSALTELLVAGNDKVMSTVIQGYGRDFGNQWKDPLSTSIESPTEAIKKTRQIAADSIRIQDFVDHLEGSPSSRLQDSDSLLK